MRKWVMSLVLIATLSSQSAAATAAVAPSAEVTVAASTRQATVGDQVQVTVKVRNATHLSGIYAKLKYDPSRMELARTTSGSRMISFGPSFGSYGGQDVDETAGSIAYPMVYSKPLDVGGGELLALTVTFKAVKAGPVSFQLEETQVTNYVSKVLLEFDSNGPTATLAVAPVMEKVPGETKISLQTVLRYMKQSSGAVPDANGDGLQDKEDVKFVLSLIEPMSLGAAP